MRSFAGRVFVGWLLWSWSAVVCQAAAAEVGASDQPEVIETPEVFISATKTETPVRHVTSAVEIITGEQMQQRKLKTVVEALRLAQGLAVFQSGGPGTLAQVRMRGGTPQQTLVLIDGAIVNSATDGKWLADFIYVHHIQRYTEGVGHRQPFYYYFMTLPADFMPWTVFAIPAVFAYFPYRRLKQRPIPLFFFLCFLVVFVFFSLSDTKRDLYLLPLLPTVALLVGNYIDDLAQNQLPESGLYRWLIPFYFCAVAGVGLALPAVAWIVRRETFWITLPAAVALTVGGIVTVVFFRQRRHSRLVTAVTLLMTSTLVCVSIWILPYMNQFKSRRPFSLQVKKIVPATAPLYVYADGMHDFNFYTKREVIPVLSSPDDVANVLRQPILSYLLIADRDLKKLSMFGPKEVVMTDSVGSTTWNLIAVRAESRAEGMSIETGH